jgi:phosphohistidine phosphatase
MSLYLIRHAHAMDSADDAGRRLSVGGRDQIKLLANFLRTSSAPHPNEVWHSTLVRARETAWLLKDSLGWKAPLAEVEGLEPDSNPLAILHRFPAARKPLAIVGHEPFLGVLGAILVTGSPWSSVFAMRKSSMLALEGGTDRPGSWIASWHLSPELFGMDS